MGIVLKFLAIFSLFSEKGLCPQYCPENYKPTCTSNGMLYVNECEMRLHACKTGKLKELKRLSRKKCK